MGADIECTLGKLPVSIKPAAMHPMNITGMIASAQVKSAILLAGVQLDGVTTYAEPMPTRDHTERMLQKFGADIKREGNRVNITGTQLHSCDVYVPNDISSAAAMVASVFMYDNSELTVCNVGLNPTRTGFLDILKSWGADIRTEVHSDNGEPYGDIIVRSSELTSIKISGEMVANAIDELPLLAMLGLFTKNGVVQ
jgi:3-phosphoshikimate 1-carboxyvinyltransferase